MSEKLEPNSKKVFMIVCCSLAIAILAQFIILGAIIVNDMKEVPSSIAAYFGVNWGNGPISTIELQSSSCPVGSSYALSDVVFPGFSAGCSCTTTNSDGTQSTTVTQQVCSSDQTSAGCISYNSSPSKIIYNWDGSMMCTQRSQSNYFQLKLATKGALCDVGYKSCGIADSIGSSLCIADTDNCPINYIQVTSQDDDVSTDPTDERPFSVNVENFSNNKKLVYSTQNVNGNVVNQFLVLDHEPCASEAENKLQLSSTPYTCQTSIDGQTTDSSWSLLDTSTLADLVNNNNLSQEMAQYPFYQSIQNENVSLYYRSYVGLSSDCIYIVSNLFNTAQLPSILTNFGAELSTSQIDYISFIAITIFAILLVGIVLKIIVICLDMPRSTRVYITAVLGVSAALLIIVSAVSTVNVANFKSDYSWFGSNCSDPISYGNIELLNQNIGTSLRLGIVYLILSAILFFFVIAEHLMITCWVEESDVDSCLEDNISDSEDEDDIPKKKTPKPIRDASINNEIEEETKDLKGDSDDEEVLVNTNKKKQ